MGAHPQTRSHISAARTAVGMPPSVNPSNIHANSPAACNASGEFDLEHFLISSGEAIVSKFRKSECIFAQGDPTDFVIYIRSGSAKMMVVSDKGKEATISVIGPGDFCGEGCLIDEPIRLQTAMTMTPSSVLRVSKKSFSRLLREHYEFSSIFTKFLLRRAIRIQQDLINQRFHSSEFRLARLLIGLSTSSGANSDQRLVTRISQETLASMVGTTRSRISFFLNKFKKAGLIEYDSGIRINPGLEEMFQGQNGWRY
jgi:CRP/FNR family transcriptional regulator, cyclic AMP receptor protein